MPRKNRIRAKRSGAARREPDEALLTGRGSLRNRELLGRSPQRESKQWRSPPPTPALCPESSCAPRGRSGLAWRGPLAPALIGRRLGQQRGRHAPGWGRADKACQGAHDLRLRKSEWSRSRAKDSNGGPGPPLRFAFLELGKLQAAAPALSRACRRKGQLISPIALAAHPRPALYPFARENKVTLGGHRARAGGGKGVL